MAKFLAVFTGEPSAGPPPDMDEAAIARGMAAWGQWMTTHAANVVDTGGPLGKTNKVSKGGVQEIRNNLAGYVVIEAASPEAAAGMFKDHPHFSIFPGDGVEVMPVLAIPGAG
jgi:hypothetical protein